MAKTYYAVEVETGSVVGDAARGLTYGYFRFVTGRPIYTGTETGDAYVPTGDNSAIKINLNGTETISVSLQSGQIYAASNGTFKTANSVLAVGERFTCLDNSDFTGGELATAKGSAPAEGDMFEVTNNTAASEAVKYVGVNKWFEDFITRDGMSNPSRSVDPEGSGDYGTLSDFTFTVKDTIVAGTDTPFWKYLASYSVTLANRNVRVYAVIDDYFYLIWSGVVENNPRSETGFVFECKNNFKAVHKDMPPSTFDNILYPNAIDSVKGKNIPVCVGDIEYTAIFNTDGEPSWVDLVRESSIDYPGAMGSNYETTTPYLELYTFGKSFAEDELKGKYLFVKSGGGSPDKDKGILIIHSSLTNSMYHLTQITLSEPLEGYIPLTYGYDKGVDADRWVFGVATIGVNNRVSNLAISSFKLSSELKAFLYQYTTEKKYEDISFMINTVTASTASMQINSPNLSKDGDVKYLYPVHITCDWLDWYLQTGDISRLTDFDRQYYMVLSHSTGPYIGFHIDTSIHFTINNLNEAKDISEVYYGIDYSIVDITAGLPYTDNYKFEMLFYYTDFYGRDILAHTLTIPTMSGDMNILPNEYYKYTGGDLGMTSAFAAQKAVVKLPTDFLNKMYNRAIGNNLKIYVKWTTLSYNSFDIWIRQAGIIGYKKIDVIGDSLYTRVSGEKTTGAAESNTVYNAFRLMLETYNELTTDKIDYGNLPTVRHNVGSIYWHVGRQLTDRKNMVDYIIELCQQSFVCAFQNRKGKIALSAWLDRTDAAKVHNNTNIVKDTITEWDLTSIDRVFNSFTVNYSYDPGGNKYFSTYQIKSPDAAAWASGYGNEELWDICKACYAIYKCVKEFKIDLSWFIDRSRWYNSGESGVGVGVEGSAYHWLEKAVFWMTRQKRKAGYNIPLNATNVLTELCDPVTFADPVFTNSLVDTTPLTGHVHSIEYDLQTDSIRIGSILQPNDSIDDNYGDIVETGSAATTITESGSQADTITENGN